METKSARVRIKDETKGTAELVFAEFGTIDKDDDVTIKGAFDDGAAIVLSAYGHKSWDGALPYGFGTIVVKNNEACADVQFLMETTHGRDAFLTVKALSEQGLQEWSYSLEDVVAERGQFEGKNVRFLKKVTVKEVSPVLRGAGTTTRTLSAKSAPVVKQSNSMIARMLNEAGGAAWADSADYVYLEDFDLDEMTAVFCVVDWSADITRARLQVEFTRNDTSVTLGVEATPVEWTTVYMPKGSKFSEHTEVALRGVKQLVETAIERIARRVEQGKSITQQSDALDRLTVELEPLSKAITAATQSTKSEANDLFANELVRFISLTQGA